MFPLSSWRWNPNGNVSTETGERQVLSPRLFCVEIALCVRFWHLPSYRAPRCRTEDAYRSDRIDRERRGQWESSRIERRIRFQYRSESVRDCVGTDRAAVESSKTILLLLYCIRVPDVCCQNTLPLRDTIVGSDIPLPRA